MLRLLIISLTCLIASSTFGETLTGATSFSDSIQEQLNAGEYKTVLELTQIQIESFDSRFDRYKPELFDPLRFRAVALLKLQEYDAAIRTSMQALQVLRMNEGLHSAKQIPIFQHLADAHEALGHAVQTNNYEEAAFAAAERVYSEDSVNLLEGSHRLAGWYMQAGYYTSARKLFERARLIAQAHLPQERHAYAKSLEGIAETYVGLAFSNFDRASNEYYSQFTPANMRFDKHRHRKIAGPEVPRAAALSRFRGGERALQELVEFWRAQNLPEKTDLIQALISLGDWHVRFRDPRAAIHSFREARLLMSSEAAEREFGAPKLLFMPIIEDPVSCSADGCDSAQNHELGPAELGVAEPLAAGQIRFLARVNNHGAVSRVTKLSSLPEDFSAFRYKQETRRARFRPAIVNDEFQDQQDVPIVHRFQYLRHNSAQNR